MYARLFGSGYHNPNGLAGIIFGRGLFVFFLSFFLFSFFSFRSGIYRFMGGFFFSLLPTVACLPTPFPNMQWSDSPRLFGMYVAASRDRTHRYAKSSLKKDPPPVVIWDSGMSPSDQKDRDDNPGYGATLQTSRTAHIASTEVTHGEVSKGRAIDRKDTYYLRGRESARLTQLDLPIFYAGRKKKRKNE